MNLIRSEERLNARHSAFALAQCKNRTAKYKLRHFAQNRALSRVSKRRTKTKWCKAESLRDEIVRIISSHLPHLWLKLRERHFIMNKHIFCTLFILLFAFSAFGQKASAAKADPAKGVHDAFDRLVEGIKQVDVTRVMSVYDKSPRLLVFNNNGTATQGWDEVKRVNEQIYPKLKNVTLEVTGLRVEMLGPKAAYVTCKWKQTQENNGKVEDSSGRMTLVFKLVGKDWKIVHRHTSPDRPDVTRPVFPSERQNGNDQ
jgi:ketosteroid isomerase-like protein